MTDGLLCARTVINSCYRLREKQRTHAVNAIDERPLVTESAAAAADRLAGNREYTTRPICIAEIPSARSVASRDKLIVSLNNCTHTVHSARTISVQVWALREQRLGTIMLYQHKAYGGELPRALVPHTVIDIICVWAQIHARTHIVGWLPLCVSAPIKRMSEFIIITIRTVSAIKDTRVFAYYSILERMTDCCFSHGRRVQRILHFCACMIVLPYSYTRTCIYYVNCCITVRNRFMLHAVHTSSHPRIASPRAMCVLRILSNINSIYQ